MYIAAYHDNTPGFERDFVSRTIAFYNDELYLRGSDGKLAKIDVPNSTGKRRYARMADRWSCASRGTVDGKTYKAGALLATRFDDFMAGKREFDVLFEPTDSTSLAGYDLDQESRRAERAGRRQEQADRAHAFEQRLEKERIRRRARARHHRRQRGGRATKATRCG